MIWTPDGCWFQRESNGVVRSSWMGQIGTIDEVAERCKETGDAFETYADGISNAGELNRVRQMSREG